ncbi:MAG: hypothetical protein ACT4P6_14180 [Gemmatimonadaceae bacterium]
MPRRGSPNAMDSVSGKLKLGAWEIDTKDDPHTELVSLTVERAMNSPVSRCEVGLFVTPAAKPGLLEQAVGEAASMLGFGESAGAAAAFSIDVRALPVAHNDPMEITLAIGDRSAKVMTASVDRIASHHGHVRVAGRAALATAARTRVDRIYLNQGLSQIAQDLASAANLQAGQIDSGDTYPYFVVDSGRSVFDHVIALAQLEGMDVYDDPDGALVMRRFSKSGADRKLHYGIHVLDARIDHDVATYGSAKVTGEGAASTAGTDRWHHLLKDPASVQAAAGDGAEVLVLGRAAARSTDAAERLAKGRLGASLDAATRGTIRLLGDPTLSLGDVVEIADAPWPDVNGMYKVDRLRHRFVKREGFVTTLGVTGMGGADAAEGMLGQLAGAIGGALGL